MNNFITPAGFKTGIEEVAPKVYAYIQAFGELGVSNAGLLLDKEGAMAVDALLRWGVGPAEKHACATNRCHSG